MAADVDDLFGEMHDMSSSLSTLLDRFDERTRDDRAFQAEMLKVLREIADDVARVASFCDGLDGRLAAVENHLSNLVDHLMPPLEDDHPWGSAGERTG
jgi:hypothetical protein